MNNLEKETQVARDAYLKALAELNAATDRGLAAERIQNLRANLETTVASLESAHGVEVGLRLQLAFLQALPIFLSSARTTSDAIYFAELITGKVLSIWYLFIIEKFRMSNFLMFQPH